MHVYAGENWKNSLFYLFITDKNLVRAGLKVEVFQVDKVFHHGRTYTPTKKGITTRVGPDIRQCRIIRPDFSFCRISSQIIRPDFSFCRIIRPDIRHIRPDPAGTGHPASGKKYQIRPTLIIMQLIVS